MTQDQIAKLIMKKPLPFLLHLAVPRQDKKASNDKLSIVEKILTLIFMAIILTTVIKTPHILRLNAHKQPVLTSLKIASIYVQMSIY